MKVYNDKLTAESKPSRFFWGMITLILIAIATNPSQERHIRKFEKSAFLEIINYDTQVNYSDLRYGSAGLFSILRVKGKVRTIGAFGVVLLVD